MNEKKRGTNENSSKLEVSQCFTLQRNSYCKGSSTPEKELWSD